MDEHGDARRDDEIARYHLLTEPAGRDLQALVELAAQICEVPTAAINVITSSQQCQIATTGVEPAVCAREDSMCAAVVEDPAPVVVPDALLDERFRTNPFVSGVIGAVRFYASAPMRTTAGLTVGRLCVFDDQPRELSAAQADALQVLAERIVDVLELRLRTRELELSLAQLTEARDELRRSNERLSEFAGQVSHDLRSPLTAILLNVEMLSLDPAVRGVPLLGRLADAALTSGRRMAGLIESMLEAAQAGGTLVKGRVDLARVTRAVLEDLAAALAETGGTVDVGELPLVEGDEQLLYSVVLNVLANAVKFTRPGCSPEVRVSAHRVTEGWRVEIADRGIGVPEDLREKVFERYTRADSATPGVGIGLATARQVMEAHGGVIGLDPVEGGGTVVWFVLPDRDQPSGSL